MSSEQEHGKKSVLARIHPAFFLLYVVLLLDLTLFSSALGRSARNLPRDYYMEMFTNFTPFYSINTVYIRGFIEGKINAWYLTLNLLGNLCIFMPFSFFLPALWKCQRKFYVFFPTVLLIGIGIEGTQFLTMRGSCDVDDVILNVGGAVFLYLLLRIPPLHRFAKRLVTGITKWITGAKKVDKKQ